jgi:hypothetical protein
MGAELPCRATFGDRSGAGKALLETTELVFRGEQKDFRFRIPLETLTKVVVIGGRLVLEGPKVKAVLELGDKYAARWAEKIKNPPTRLDKLGVAAGQKVAIVGDIEAGFLAELAQKQVTPLPADAVVEGARLDLIFFVVAAAADLARLPALKAALAPAGGLWILRPKGGKAAAAAGTLLKESEVRSAARAAGLVDVKTAAFSPTHGADKYVVPVAKR